MNHKEWCNPRGDTYTHHQGSHTQTCGRRLRKPKSTPKMSEEKRQRCAYAAQFRGLVEIYCSSMWPPRMSLRGDTVRRWVRSLPLEDGRGSRRPQSTQTRAPSRDQSSLRQRCCPGSARKKPGNWHSRRRRTATGERGKRRNHGKRGRSSNLQVGITIPAAS